MYVREKLKVGCNLADNAQDKPISKGSNPQKTGSS